jgi:MFS family permease
MPVALESQLITSDVPARLDRLPWSQWHWLIVIALGITWVLDGLEVTLAGAIGGVLKRPDALGLSDAQVGASATCYLLGAVIGALVFGYSTDRLGRKRLFIITLLLYLTATALTALSWNFFSYALFRALTGAGIGGEYSAINSAIDELIPARVRGRVDLIINGSFWIGAAIGAAASIGLLDTGNRSDKYRLAAGFRHRRGIGSDHHFPAPFRS